MEQVTPPAYKPLDPSASRARSEAIAPDLPLPVNPSSTLPWLRQAVVLQPWGATQYTALTDVGDRPRRLREEFGFNAIIVLPPAAHNAITDPAHHLTEDAFAAALGAYRKAGYKVILYTGIMHCGHAPEWMSHRIEREHPDWSQRDPQGNPIATFGASWLCPNTGALAYTLAYTLRIARRYRADGMMLDNNEYFGGPAGWTCHCDACQRRFQDYVRRRFGPEEALRLFGVKAEEVRIPTVPGPLHALWLHWRNRVWAEANALYCTRLRQQNSRIFVFANTQYQFGDAMLASDLQYEQEDVLLSESRGLTSWQMSEKMLLGQALAAGRPLWNYIGTFEEEDFTRLRPQEVVGPILAASLAHGARPWIVYYGFDDNQGEYRARKEMSDLLQWYATHPDLFAGRPWAPVGAVISTRSRDLLGRPLIPPHLVALLREGVPVAGIRDEHLSAKNLKGYEVLTLEGADCLEESAAHAVAAWVRAGGKLLATPGAGTCDLLGRKRTRSALWAALELKACPEREVRVGRGRVLCVDPKDLVQGVSAWTREDAFRFTADAPVEVVVYRAFGRVLLHLIRHAPVNGTLVLRLPPALRLRATTATLYAPGREKGGAIPVANGAITLRDLPVYSVVAL